MVTFLVHSIAPMFWWIFLVSLCFSCSFLPDPFWFLCIILTLCLFQLSHVWTKWALARLNVGCLGTQGQAICHVSRNYSWLTVTFSITLLRNCWSDAEASCEMLKTENFRSHQRPNAFRVLSDGTPRRLGFTFKFEMHWYMNSLYLYSKDGLVFHLLSPTVRCLELTPPCIPLADSFLRLWRVVSVWSFAQPRNRRLPGSKQTQDRLCYQPTHLILLVAMIRLLRLFSRVCCLQWCSSLESPGRRSKHRLHIKRMCFSRSVVRPADLHFCSLVLLKLLIQGLHLENLPVENSVLLPLWKAPFRWRFSCPVLTTDSCVGCDPVTEGSMRWCLGGILWRKPPLPQNNWYTAH